MPEPSRKEFEFLYTDYNVFRTIKQPTISHNIVGIAKHYFIIMNIIKAIIITNTAEATGNRAF